MIYCNVYYRNGDYNKGKQFGCESNVWSETEHHEMNKWIVLLMYYISDTGNWLSPTPFYFIYKYIINIGKPIKTIPENV